MMYNCLEKAKILAILGTSNINNIENINQRKEQSLLKIKKGV